MMREETKIRILRNIYGAVETMSKMECYCNFLNHDWKGYQNCVYELSLCKTARFAKGTIEMLLDLPNLRKLDLFDYNCRAQLTYDQYEKLKSNGIEIILNKNLTYKDPDVQNQNIYDRINHIKDERNFYQNKVELCDAMISDLESKLIKKCND